MSEPQPGPSAAAIRAGLRPHSLWREVECVASTGSTNADVAALARAGAPEGHVLVADEQTRGRGRLGRTWASPAGSSVAISVLLRPTQPMAAWGWLSLLAGLAVGSAVAELSPRPELVQLKWPNDVLIDGGKVCGILSERVEGPAGAAAVVGMGINLGEAELPVPTATSLAREGFDADPDRVVATVLTWFERYYGIFQDRGTLRQEYQARCASVGTELSITVGPGNVVSGIGVGVDDHGRLLVDTGSGVSAFAVGDVVHARLLMDS